MSKTREQAPTLASIARRVYRAEGGVPEGRVTCPGCGLAFLPAAEPPTDSTEPAAVSRSVGGSAECVHRAPKAAAISYREAMDRANDPLAFKKGER